MNTVSIYHGYESDGRLVFGYGRDKGAMPDIAVFAYRYNTDKEGTDLENIYRRNNAVTGDEINVLNKARSLSVGDIVGIARTGSGSVVEYHLVESMGFTLIAEDGELPSAINLVSKEFVENLRNSMERT